MKGFQGPQQAQGAPAGTDPSDPTGAGGGTIGTGVAPTPQEQGFTGRDQSGTTKIRYGRLFKRQLY